MRVSCLAAVGLAVLGLAGCGGPSGVKVSGQVLNNGTPYSVPEGDEMTVQFMGAERTLSATVNPDGTFDLTAAAGGKLPPGEYTVAVTQAKYAGGKGDKFNDEFSPENTKLKCTIPDKSAKVVIDIAAKTVTIQ